MWVQDDSSTSDMKECWDYSISTSTVRKTSEIVFNRIFFHALFHQMIQTFNSNTMQYNTAADNLYEPSSNPQAEKK